MAEEIPQSLTVPLHWQAFTPAEGPMILDLVKTQGDRHILSHRVMARQQWEHVRGTLVFRAQGPLMGAALYVPDALAVYGDSLAFVVVAAQWRQLGLGNLLWGHLLDLAAAENVPIHTTVGATNLPSIRLMLAQGMVLVDAHAREDGRILLHFATPERRCESCPEILFSSTSCVSSTM